VARKKKKPKKIKELCPVCQRPVKVSDYETVFTVLIPKGVSEEIFREAFMRAAEAEEMDPSLGPQRDAFRMIAVMRLRKFSEDEEQQTIAGHALVSLGARLIALHPKCAEMASDAPGEYETYGWRGDTDGS